LKIYNFLKPTIFIFGISIAVTILYWAQLDTRPQPVIDEYVEKIFNLADAIKEKSFLEYPRALYWATIGPRLPLYQAIAAPFVLFLDRSADSILIVNAIFLVILGMAIYKAGELVDSPLVGALSAVFVMTYPLVLDLARLARPHALLPAASAIFFWVALSFIKKSSILKSWLLIASVFLIFLTHASGLYVVLVPLLLVIGKFLLKDINIQEPRMKLAYLKENLNNRIFLFGLIPAGSLLIGFIILWMLLKWDQYLSLQKVIKDVFAPQFGFWYIEKTFPDAVSPFFAGLFVIGVIILLVFWIASNKQHEAMKFVILSLILTIVFIQTFFSGAFHWNNFVSILPLVAIISASGLVYARNFLITTMKSALAAKIISYVAILICMSMALINYIVVMWLTPAMARQIQMLGVKSDCTRQEYFCPDPPVMGEWHLKEILSQVIKYDHCKKSLCRIVLVSQRPEYFHHEALTYTMVQYYSEETISPVSEIYPVRTVSIERTGRGDNGNFNWLFSDFIIFLTDDSGNPIRQLTPGFVAGGDIEYSIVKYILDHTDDGTFEKLIERRLPNGLTAVLVSKKIRLDKAYKIMNEMDILDNANRLLRNP
jgi:Pyruvate/2-oxoacid:ferredoxin oxidoreductase delta subunit